MIQTVSVIGTIFIDCKGFARESYLPEGRNLGRIAFVHGGVGRNVAETLANLGLSVSFVSTFDSNALGQEVLARLHHSNVDTTYLMDSPINGMGMWLAVMNERGSLVGSISQMPDLALLEQLFLEQGEAIVKQSSHVILELDLNEQLSQQVIQLAASKGKPIYGIPGNLDVVLKNVHLLDDLDCFICNHIEAERLLHTSFTDLQPEALIAGLIVFVDSLGLKSMVITLGEQGCIYYDSATKASGYQSVYPVKMVDSSGAGDAFFSGTVMGLIRGMALPQAVIYGTKVAGWTIESEENTCLDIAERMKLDDKFRDIGINN